jgi:hypothetical protein
MTNAILLHQSVFREVGPIVQRPIEEHSPRTAKTRSIMTNSKSSLSRSQSFMVSAEEDNLSDPTLNGFQYPEVPSQSFLYTDTFRETTAFDYDDTESRIRISDTQTYAQRDETLVALFNDIEYFRGKLSKSENERRRMAENERVRQNFQAWSFPEILEERNKTVADLNQRLQDQDFVQPFLEKKSGKRALPNRDKIKSSYEDMRKNIMALSVFEDIHYTADEIRGINSKDLSSLRDRVLSEVAQPSLPDNVSYSLDIWVQSLTGAAVCEWVFKGKYQCTAMMNTPLLDAYRRALSTFCEQPRSNPPLQPHLSKENGVNMA